MGLKELKDLGVNFSTAYKNDQAIDKIQLPLTPVQWTRLCQRENDSYIGGCCGQTGYLQDYLNAWFRDDGWADAKDWDGFCRGMASHDGEDDFTDTYIVSNGLKKSIDEFKGVWDRDDVSIWAKLAIVWQASKDCLTFGRAPRHGHKPNELQDAVRVIETACRSLSWARLFGDHPAQPGDAQKRTGRAMMLCRLYPALKTLFDKIDDLRLGPVEGHAIYIPGEDEIATNGYGFCVYETEKEAHDMIKQWRSNPDDEDDKKRMEALQVRPVRVTVENGLEYV
jgi:hypothetical protein